MFYFNFNSVQTIFKFSLRLPLAYVVFQGDQYNHEKAEISAF